jgi:bla regulator protein BlaR1
VAVSALFCVASNAAMAIELDQKDVEPLFKKYKTGCFELLDVSTGKIFRYNPELCAKPMPPQSTFKLFNAMAGLDCGVLKGANHPMKWDGKKHELETWNHDQTLASAMRDSVVWYFQNVASQIGEERMKKYIDGVKYGNEDISGGITQFWMDSSLKITADQQVDFVRRWYAGSLPFSPDAIKTVKEITELKKTEKGELHGKTGSDGKDGRLIMGWFVGYVVHDNKPYAFACNVQADDHAWGRKAREITESILSKAGLL